VKIFPAVLFALPCLLIAACSDHSDSDNDRKPTQQSLREKEPKAAGEKESEEKELTPGPDEIGEDCVGFLRATTVPQPNAPGKACPECPSGTAGFEVLKFHGFKIEKISPSEVGCEVTVEIRAEFNPSPGGTIAGGLTAWIPPEKREQYAQGHTPAGEQLYKVKVTYRRPEGFWKAVEFEPAGQK
jgi:hypothetical protein